MPDASEPLREVPTVRTGRGGHVMTVDLEDYDDTCASPTDRHRALVAEFLASYQRPCACALELRSDAGLRCASCDRQFVRRHGGAT